MDLNSSSRKERKNRSGIPGAIGQNILKLEKHYVTVMGANIRYFRTKRGLRLIDLASEAGITQSYLYKIENAYFDCNPSISVLIRLAAVLDVAPFSLFVDFEELPNKNVFDAYFEGTDISMVAEPSNMESYLSDTSSCGRNSRDSKSSSSCIINDIKVPYPKNVRRFEGDECGLSSLNNY